MTELSYADWLRARKMLRDQGAILPGDVVRIDPNAKADPELARLMDEFVNDDLSDYVGTVTYKDQLT